MLPYHFIYALSNDDLSISDCKKSENTLENFDCLEKNRVVSTTLVSNKYNEVIATIYNDFDEIFESKKVKDMFANKLRDSQEAWKNYITYQCRAFTGDLEKDSKSYLMTVNYCTYNENMERIKFLNSYLRYFGIYK